LVRLYEVRLLVGVDPVMREAIHNDASTIGGGDTVAVVHAVFFE
jgi:hypothetical protein